MKPCSPEPLTNFAPAKARELAERAAALLNEIDALGVGVGQLHTPGGIIRIRSRQGWTITDR